MTDAATLDAVVRQVLTGQAPQRLRSAAARGALPLPRVVLIRLFVHLGENDPDPDIRVYAEQSLTALPVEAVRECLAEPGCDTAVLAHFTPLALKDAAVAERVIFHPATPDASLATLAASGNNTVVELILTNQERLLRRPALLERLMANATLRAEQRGRLLELLERAAKLQADAAAVGQEKAEDEIDLDVGDVHEVANLLEVDVGELLSASEIIDGEEFAASPEKVIRDAYRKIITLNTAQKAILAMKGGREERMILIRDSNRTVSVGVLKNPRITEAEVESIAKMRNVCEDVLRQVGSKRDWTKHYQVVLALTNNPRTPQGMSANFVSRLTNRDLKHLFGNRDAPELIRRMARRTFDIRTTPVSGFKKKG